MIAIPIPAALPSPLSGVHSGEVVGLASMGGGFAFLWVASSGSSWDNLRVWNGAAGVPERIPIALRCTYFALEIL